MNKIRIKEVIRLGTQTSSDKHPPILVRFGHPTERNQMLPQSRNLPRGITVDKFVPKLYLKKHKEFKKLAWKLKTVHDDIHTQVIFDSYNLVLRYKKKDEGANQYNYIIEKEFHPKPEDSNILSRPEARDPNKKDTPTIDISKQARCNRSIIVSRVPETIDDSNATKDIIGHLDNRDHHHLMEVQFKSKGTVVLVCKDWASCKLIFDKYAKTRIQDKEVLFTMFSENEPST